MTNASPSTAGVYGTAAVGNLSDLAFLGGVAATPVVGNVSAGVGHSPGITGVAAGAVAGALGSVRADNWYSGLAGVAAAAVAAVITLGKNIGIPGVFASAGAGSVTVIEIPPTPAYATITDSPTLLVSCSVMGSTKGRILKTFNVGSVPTLEATFTSPSTGEPVSPPVVVLRFCDAGGTVTVYTGAQITNVSTGVYTCVLPVLLQAGIAYFRWEGSGAGATAMEGAFNVLL